MVLRATKLPTNNREMVTCLMTFSLSCEGTTIRTEKAIKSHILNRRLKWTSGLLDSHRKKWATPGAPRVLWEKSNRSGTPYERRLVLQKENAPRFRRLSEFSEELIRWLRCLPPPKFITPLICRKFFYMRNLSLLAHFLRRGARRWLVGWPARRIRQIEGNIDVQP
jgi:hypothetical protein